MNLSEHWNKAMAGDGEAACVWLAASAANSAQLAMVGVALSEIVRLRAEAARLRALLGRDDPERCPCCSAIRERAEVTGDGVCRACGSGPTDRGAVVEPCGHQVDDQLGGVCLRCGAGG